MEFTDSLLLESWILWVLGVIVVACRLFSRRMKLGKWDLLAIEDYLMVFALVNFTGVVVCINEVAKNGSNYMPQEVAEALDAKGRSQATFGSIMTFVLEIFTLTAVWTIKACLLLLYFRLTSGTSVRQRWGVRIVACYCGLTYILCIFLFVFYWCSPNTKEYWAVPVNIDQCATYYNHMIFTTACNISSDLMLLLIPIPIMLNLRLPTKRKIGLVCIFGLGLFNILAAVLNRYYNFSNPNSYVFLYWYVAEVGVAMYVGNLPLCWPVIRLAIGSKGDSSDQSYPTPGYPNPSHPSSANRYKSGSGHHPLTSKASIWAKLDDDGEARSDGSPEGDASSQIELVDQNSRPDLVKQPYRANADVSSHPQNGQPPRLADRITVTTDVAITTTKK